MTFSYFTIKAPVQEVLLKEKGSKFLGYAFPVLSEAELQERLKQIREAHPKATHHCYAFRLGLNGENYRANDDGEPSGSAGLPIYNQLLAHQLTHLLVVVVRYYGGTKLGVSGLVKAYKETAKLTLQQAEIITKELEMEIEIHFPFAQQNTLFSLLNRFQAKVLRFDAAEICTLSAQIRMADLEKILEILSDLPGTTFEVTP